MMKLALCIVLIGVLCDQALGHGRLMEPPARNSMWRSGFDNPKNYCDHCLNCGNKTRHLEMNGGKCGLCGDPYDGVREHEAGGKFAPVDRPIPRCYERGQDTTIPVTVRITAYHRGYFEFHLCVNNDLTEDPGIECFNDANILTIAGTDGQTKYNINGNVQSNYNFALVLPDKKCNQCILRWEYTTGNSWGCENGVCGKGYGPQEQFINCADIAIRDDCDADITDPPSNQVTNIPVETNPPATNGPIVTNAPTTNAPIVTNAPASNGPILTNAPSTNGPIVTNAPATNAPIAPNAPVPAPSEPNQNPTSNDVTCRANQIYENVEGMNDWCGSICREPLNLFCPQTHCICD